MNKDILRVIDDFLFDQESVNLAMTSPYTLQFFRKNIVKTRLHRKEVFRCIGFGQRTKAAALLESDPGLWEKLLRKKNRFVDCGGRIFICTLFQYALWALDRFTWEIIENFLNKIDEKEAARQLREFEDSQGLVYTLQGITYTEKHYNFNELIHPPCPQGS